MGKNPFSMLFCLLAVVYGCAAWADNSPAADPAAASEAAPAATQEPAATQDPATDQVRQGEARRFSALKGISSEWWVLYKSPQISELVNLTFKANPNIELAQATLRQVQEHSVVREGFFYPPVDANNLPLRRNSAGRKNGNTPALLANSPAYYDIHINQLTVGYVPDVIGMNALKGEPAKVQTEIQREAINLTLASNVVAAAIQVASLREQIEAQLRIIGLNRQAMEIVHNQLNLGYVSEQDVTHQEMIAALAQQELVPLQTRLDQSRDLVRILTGNLPDPDEDTEDVFTLDELHVQHILPSSLSSKLAEQRPDVRIVAAQLYSTAARYGLEVVKTLPQFNITGATGDMASSRNWMLKNGGQFFDLQSNASQYIFNAKALRAKSRAAQQELTQATTRYRSVVMFALQNLADAMNIIEADERALKEVEKAAQEAIEKGKLTLKQYESGAVDFKTLRVAQQNEQRATINLLQAQTNRLGDTALLFQALGGGWWNHEIGDQAKTKQQP